jgi:DNA polymerase-1
MTATRPTLVLIDGSSYLFRAFHALPQLTNKAGEPTGALFGVFNMLRATLKKKPAHLAFVIDAGGKNFRHELYPEYKANRPPTPPDLKAQVEPLLAVVEALGIPLLRIAGVEADDVIGTLARQAEAAGMDVLISTGDKDFAQLVGPHITLVNTMTNSATDAAGVIEKFGVRADQVVDLLALMGDSVDNIPGVEKCGPKTAAKWLAEYDTLDQVMAHADKVGGKIGEYLRAALPQLPLSRQLATIRTDVALPMSPEALNLGAPDPARQRELYTRYEFNAALKELDSAGAVAAPVPATSSATTEPAVELPPIDRSAYELVLTQAQWQTWLKRLHAAEAFAFDTETTGLDPQQAELVGVSFATAPGVAAYVPLAHDYAGAPAQLPMQDVLADLKPLLESERHAKIGQHGKYDMHILARLGIEVRGYRYDTMLESYVWNATATRHDMDSLAKLYLNHDTIHYEDVAGKGAKQILFSQVALEQAGAYAAEDADVTLRLHRTLWPKLESLPSVRRVFEEIEMPLVPVLARMERQGMLIDAQDLKRQSSEMRTRMHELVQRAHASIGHSFNLDSPKQLQQVLFEELKLPVKNRTATGQASTNEEALEELVDDHELPRLILEYRMLAKLVSTYTEKLPEQINPRTGRVHTSFHQAVATTGRLSSTDPNLQNIPIRTEEGRRIRRAFIAAPGYRIMAADYSQIELRLMAHMAEDPGLLRAFRDGLDIHRATAAEVFGLNAEAVDANQRRAAKAINFGLMYGMGAHGLARQLGITRGQAQEYIDRYFSRYPGVRAFMDHTRERARREGYVETLFGRRVYLNEIRAKSQAARAGAERVAINAPLQGTAADIIKRAMIAVDAWLVEFGDDARMILQVHDELVLEVREARVDVVRAGLSARMSGAADLRVPLDVDVGVGESWDAAH